MSAKSLFFSRLTQVVEHVDDPSKTATTLTAIAAKGATSVTVAAITGVIAGATIRVGSGETCEWNQVSGSPSGSTVNLSFPLGQAHAIGEQSIPGISYDLGEPDDTGVKVSIDLGSTDVNLSTRRTTFTIVKDYATAMAEWALPTITLPGIASAIGMKQTRVTGAGTSSSPYQLNVDGSQLGEDINRGVLVAGILDDGTALFVELHGCDKDYTVVKSTFKQGQLASIPQKAIVSSQIVIGTAVPGYTIDSSKKPTKAMVFNLPQEFGIYSPAGTPMSTTLSADAAVAATSFTAVDTTNGVAADRVLFDSGDASEILILATVPDGTHFTTKNAANYAHLSGGTVVEQQQVPFGGVTEEGLDLTFGGSTKDIPLAIKRFKGIIPATAMMTLAFQIGDLKLANIAYVTGAPQADISGGRLVLNTNIGTSDIPAAYFRGITQGGKTIEINAFGITQDIKGIAAALSAKDVAKLPVTMRPSTIQFLQY